MRLPQREPDYAAISKRVDEEFACKHAHNTVRKKLAADGAISIWQQCDRCGHKVSIAIKKATMTLAQVQALPTWDTQLESRFYAEKKKYFDESYAAEKKRHADAWHCAYDQYLHSPEWKRKSKLVMLRAQGICEGCRETEAIDAHHLSYDDVGHEFLFQLVALCRKCHDKLHGRIPSVSSPPSTLV
jgi:transposase